MIYKIMGKPIPLKRPRTSFINRLVYDPQKKEKEDAIIQLRLQHKKLPILDGPLNLKVTFYMPVPASFSHKKKNMLFNMPHFKKPDLSNLLKWTEDVAVDAGIFTDDARIIHINAKKIYAEIPRTEFTLTREVYEEERASDQV